MALTQITGGDGIKDGSIKEADLNIDNTPTNEYVLTAKSSAAGGRTWAEGGSGAQGGGSDKIFWENGTTVTTSYTITNNHNACLLYTSPSPRDRQKCRMPSSA